MARLITNENSDLLVGSQGGDTFDATFGGPAQMFGLGGNDIYIVNDNGDQAIEQPGGGIDTIVAQNMWCNTYVMGSNIENFTMLSGSNNDITGNASDNLYREGTGDAAHE